ncbi:hypothetical protein Tco_0332983 [Tanacetum coccineum]
MIACVEKTAQNADFYQIIDYLTGCSINYSLLVDPDLIGPWLQQFWATASLRVINDVPHIRAMVAGKKIFNFERNHSEMIYSLMSHGVDCFLSNPQWKYLVHVLLHCLSPKSTSWEQFGTNIASALVEGVTRPKNFLPSVTLPFKVFTFMRKHSPKFSCRIYSLASNMLEVVTALAAEEEHSTSPHSRAASSARDAQGTPTQSAAQASISTAQDTAGTQGTAQAQDTDDVQDTDPAQGAAAIPITSQCLYFKDASQTSGGDEGLSGFILHLEHGKIRRLKRQTLSQAKQILKLKTKLKKTVQIRTNEWSNITLFGDDYTEVHFFEYIGDKDADVTPDLERKKLDLEAIQSTARQSTITPRTLNFSDEAAMRFKHSGPYTISTSTSTNHLKLLTRKIRQRDLGRENQKEEINSSTNQRLETTMSEEVARKRFKLNGMQKKKEKV